MIIKKLILPLVAVVLLPSCSMFERSSKKTLSSKSPQQVIVIKADSTKKILKPYKEIITDKAITQKGLFKVHKVDERYYFEIPDSLLDRKMLLINRIIKAPVTASGFGGFGGDLIGQNLVEFSRGPANKLFIKWINYVVRPSDSTDDGLFKAVQNSTFQPIVASFDIKALSPDSASSVIDMTDYLNADNDVFFFGYLARTASGYNLNSLGYQADKSFITTILSFPLNVEIKTVKTYSKGTDLLSTLTYELNSSLVLLPKEPMRPRYQDKRVGYFNWGYYDYSASQPVQVNRIITRWRLEPKEEDIEKYKRGELVEPKKPIVYYIDPATPKKWVPYLIQGVNDWQKAFEKAGFKNAIYALEAPVNDSTWSLEDARHSAIVYKASLFQNASGPQVSDPRSGEIIETHINWYHNIQELLHNWYMIQVGPNDPGARKMQFDDTLMGQLIRYVCTHEVGHTLGLLHNFRASSIVPVDSLRSKQYVRANGYCPSIMDYARFNYVAQPEDGFQQKDLIPRIGVYDQWAIEWGYKWMTGFKTDEEEKSFLSSWVASRLENDKRIWFGGEVNPLDASWLYKNQSEDLGDNAMKAGYYGIKNLKRIIPLLKEWTKEPNKDYESLRNMNDEVIAQYMRYLFHVANYIGGHAWTQKNVEQEGEGLSFPSEAEQKTAIQFLNDELFTTPQWLLNDEIFRLSVGDEKINYVNPGNIYRLLNIQGMILTKVISYQTYTYLLLQQTTAIGKVYSIDELFTDLEAGIWKELNTKEPIDIYRRDLQKIYVEQLTRQLNPRDEKGKIGRFDASIFAVEQSFNDVLGIIKDHLRNLLTKINIALPSYKDKMSRLHLIEVRDRIIKSLYDQSGIFLTTPGVAEKERKNAFYPFEMGHVMDKLYPQKQSGCWDVENDLGNGENKVMLNSEIK